MVELLSPKGAEPPPLSSQLLNEGEVVVIVDDSPEIVLLLDHYLSRQGIPVAKAANSGELYHILNTERVAIILLDIGLPGKSGTEILADIAPRYPDIGIIMVTGSIDVQLAMECLRQGADDYLTKPVNPRQFNHTLLLTLKKRRLALDNKIFQKELEAANFRMQFLHNLNLKMNTAYLNALELDSVLQTILAGITSEEGLQFNRAFLALFDRKKNLLSGRLAVGPSSREEAGRLWQDIKRKNLGLHDILDGIIKDSMIIDSAVNRVAKALIISAEETDHILIHSCMNRKSINVINGKAENVHVPKSLLQLLDEQNFVVAPLYSPGKSLGVIIADNFVTHAQITANDIMALEIFASQASLAIEHSQLYQDMTAKIKELELVTQELENNKDMLIEAERYATIGYISAQLVHAIRNPVTSIGGTARLLAKRIQDESMKRFLQVLTEETAKIEATLNDIFQFVENITINTKLQAINTILEASVAIFVPTLQKCGISHELTIPQEDILLEFDALKIRQVLMNLIRNSIEAMEPGGRLKVELVENEDSVTISIIDSGKGISTSNLSMVTDPFFTTKTYGTGLGLTLVEQILDLHKATFSLEQTWPSGMKASIVFPQPPQP